MLVRARPARPGGSRLAAMCAQIEGWCEGGSGDNGLVAALVSEARLDCVDL